MTEKIEVTTNARGFEYAQFTDIYGQACSIQMSSLAEDVAIWLGVEKDLHGHAGARMHLNRSLVAELLPMLNEFMATGYISPAPRADTGTRDD